MKRKTISLIIIGAFLFALLLVSILSALYYFSSNQIMIIPIKGSIQMYSSGSSLLFSSESASSESIVSQIKQANFNPQVKAIVLEINSPGGGVVATEEISRAVLDSRKPVVAWIREIGASGAYWIASSSDSVVAHPFSLIGSIGVTASYIQYAGLMEDYGVKYERVVSGKYKDMGSPYKNLTKEERTLLEATVKSLNRNFISHVSTARGISYSDAEALADGRLFLGEEAKEYNLVDVLGSEKEAKQEAENLAGMSLGSGVLVRPSSKQAFSIFSFLSESEFIGSSNLELKAEA